MIKKKKKRKKGVRIQHPRCNHLPCQKFSSPHLLPSSSLIGPKPLLPRFPQEQNFSQHRPCPQRASTPTPSRSTHRLTPSQKGRPWVVPTTCDRVWVCLWGNHADRHLLPHQTTTKRYLCLLPPRLRCMERRHQGLLAPPVRISRPQGQAPGTHTNVNHHLQILIYVAGQTQLAPGRPVQANSNRTRSVRGGRECNCSAPHPPQHCRRAP